MIYIFDEHHNYEHGFSGKQYPKGEKLYTYRFKPILRCMKRNKKMKNKLIIQIYNF